MYKLSKADRQFIENRRGVYHPELAWYAVMTHWGHEQRVGELILQSFGRDCIQDTLLPELQEPDHSDEQQLKRGLLFGGYVFIHCRMNDAIYMDTVAIPKVIRILGHSFRIPQVIQDEEMRLFKGVLISVPQPQLVTRCQVGRVATVTGGLMHGLQGRVIGVSAQLVKLETSFSFLDPGKALVVSVPHDQISFAADAHDRPDHAD